MASYRPVGSDDTTGWRLLISHCDVDVARVGWSRDVVPGWKGHVMFKVLRRRWVRLSALGLLVGGLAVAVQTSASAATATSITINGAQGGRVFDGVGAISGGGGNSRLLIDYPSAQRAQILDYLFKPGYGASLQILKVEVGGNGNSTDGSESSHEPTKGAVSCNTGYEWWLMGEAKARNPNIVFSALAWTAPGWVGNGKFFTADSIGYLIDWLNCARSQGFDVRYLGGLNEKTNWTASWFVQLRSALDSHGFGLVRIVAVDDWRPSPGWDKGGGWGVVDALNKDSAFDKAVSVVGGHYPCQGNNGGNANTCPTPPTAVALGKPLWMSEGGSQDYNTGAGPWIRSIVRPELRQDRPHPGQRALVRKLLGGPDHMGQRACRAVHPTRLDLHQERERLPRWQRAERHVHDVEVTRRQGLLDDP